MPKPDNTKTISSYPYRNNSRSVMKLHGKEVRKEG
jgi:hypothetical protein